MENGGNSGPDAHTDTTGGRSTGGWRLSPGMLLGGMSLLGVLVIVAALLVALATRGQDAATPVTSILPPETPQPQGTPIPTTPPLGATVPPPSGWNLASGTGLATYPQGQNVASIGIAFASSNPSIGYLCMPSADGMLLMGTTDGGQTWHKVATACAAQDQNVLSIDPANPNDVLLAEYSLPPATSQTKALLRSVDGGRTWAAVKLPIAAGYDLQTVGWAGSTALLCVTPASASGDSPLAVFISPVNSPFTRLDKHGTIGGVALASFAQMGGNASELFIATDGNTLVSADEGKTWTQRAWTYQGQPVSPMSIVSGANGTAILGEASAVVVSTDDGVTWHALPDPAGSPVAGGGDEWVAPDGTVFIFPVNKQHLYAVRPGSKAWTSVLDVPPSVRLQATLSGVEGHPMIEWATYQPDPNLSASELIWHKLR